MNEWELNRLIEKYYNGISTEEDEKALRAYFIENSAPPGYETEKEIFTFFMESTEVPEPTADFEARIRKVFDVSSAKNRSGRLRKLLIPFISAAAGILILVGSYFFLIHRDDTQDTFTDPEIAYAETMKILMDVSSQLNHGAGSLRPVGKINEMKIKSFESINKSAVLIEKNLKSLEYLRNSTEINMPHRNR